VRVGGGTCLDQLRTSEAGYLVIGGWLALEGSGVLEDRGDAFDQHTVYGDTSVLDTPLLREVSWRVLE